MSEICTCRNADIRESSGGKYCGRCGFWWDTRYGSVEPGTAPEPEPATKQEVYGKAYSYQEAKQREEAAENFRLSSRRKPVTTRGKHGKMLQGDKAKAKRRKRRRGGK